MKLTKQQLSKIEAEVFEAYRQEGKKISEKIIKELKDLSYYLTPEQIKEFKKVPEGYCPKVKSARIDTKLIKNKPQLIKKNTGMQFVRDICLKGYSDERMEIEIDEPFELPAYATIYCNCNSSHAIVIKDCTELVKELIEFEAKAYELKKIMSQIKNSVRTLKSLKDNYIGIELLAPKAMREIESGVSVGELVVKTNLTNYAVGLKN